MFFIEKEYVIFYELDITTIHGLNNNIHKSKTLVKYFTNYWFFLYKNVPNFLQFYKLSPIISYTYLFYYINRYNKNIKIRRNFWKSSYNYKIITLHHKSKKLNITVKNSKRILITLSSGISTKKLGIEEKKNKKSIKVFNIMIKSIFKNIKPSNQLLKCILQIKGTNFYLYKYIDYINQLKFKFKEVYFIYTPIITHKPKFKKIRSLKKNFRKNFLSVN